jgi:putative hydrolase of the HAD superfamily
VTGIDVVALDADDTLWKNEVMFAAVHDQLRDLIGRHCERDLDVDAALADVERKNLEIFGYGVKAFTLSMIETAITLTNGRIPADEIHEIVGWGKWILNHPVELLPGVAETVPTLSSAYRLVLITKGDLLNQEAKIAGSGLADHFDVVEVVAEKDVETYERLLDTHGIDPATFVMVGNSLRSDIVPVVAIGGRAIHIAAEYTWELERVDPQTRAAHANGYVELDDFAALATVLAQMADGTP